MAFLLICVALLFRITHAFNPSWGLVLGVGVGSKWFTDIAGKDGISSWGRPHEAMTDVAITSRYGPYFGLSTPTKWMKLARNEIVQGSKIVDRHGDKEAEDPTCHFDNEKFFESNERLRNARKDIVA